MDGKLVPPILSQLAKDVGGTITEVSGPLSDGSGFAIMSMPLPKDHWLYKKDPEGFNVPPMPFRMGVHDAPRLNMTREMWGDAIREAGRYAIKCATFDGKDMDFDPDALVQNLITGMLGYFTEDGLSSDDWANPPEFRK